MEDKPRDNEQPQIDSDFFKIVGGDINPQEPGEEADRFDRVLYEFIRTKSEMSFWIRDYIRQPGEVPVKEVNRAIGQHANMLIHYLLELFVQQEDGPIERIGRSITTMATEEIELVDRLNFILDHPDFIKPIPHEELCRAYEARSDIYIADTSRLIVESTHMYAKLISSHTSTAAAYRPF